MSQVNSVTLQVAAGLSPLQQDLFYREYNQHAKNYTLALLLAIFFGWSVGAHNFYLGRYGRGILHIVLALLTLTVIPLILTIIDIINLRKTVDTINSGIANEIAAKLRAMPTSF